MSTVFFWIVDLLYIGARGCRCVQCIKIRLEMALPHMYQTFFSHNHKLTDQSDEMNTNETKSREQNLHGPVSVNAN